MRRMVYPNEEVGYGTYRNDEKISYKNTTHSIPISR